MRRSEQRRNLGEGSEAVNNSKVYLGDSVYASYEGGCGIWLTTENGLTGPSNRIFIEPEVYSALVMYWERLKTEGARR